MLPPDKLQKVQKKLSKLLALSASPIQAEADSALAKCNELMERYGIASIDVDPVSLKVSTEDIFVKGIGKRMPKWHGILAVNIAQVFDTLVISTRNTASWDGLTFVGGKSDVRIVVDLFVSLRRTIGKMGSEAAKYKYNTERYRDAYCMGVALTVSRRLSSLFNDCSISSLVVIKQSEVTKHMEDKFGAIRCGSVDPCSFECEEATRKGKLDGENVPLQKAIPTENKG